MQRPYGTHAHKSVKNVSLNKENMFVKSYINITQQSVCGLNVNKYIHYVATQAIHNQSVELTRRYCDDTTRILNRCKRFGYR